MVIVCHEAVHRKITYMLRAGPALVQYQYSECARSCSGQGWLQVDLDNTFACCI